MHQVRKVEIQWFLRRRSPRPRRAGSANASAAASSPAGSGR